jgi:tetratricopeptide (TPR) repeat protein
VPQPPGKYWAFLSYSSQDRGSATWLQRVLENYVVPRRLVGRSTPAGPAPRRLRPIFRDRSDLAAHPDLVAGIASALERSAYLIVICSPHAAKSHWVNDEIVRYRTMHGEARILTVIVDGPRSDHELCFPPALRYRTGSETHAERHEPIAADLRPGGDGRRMALLKLLAGMLGVGLDELVRRDTQRRNRQLIAITAASLAGVVIAATLAIAAAIARNEAQAQRAQAEGLIEFMLTDLRKKLEPSGRLDAMDGVGRHALMYYAAQKPHDLDAQSLGRRARALRLMGEIMVQRGDLGEALGDFEQASATTQELLARTPHDGQIIFNHAQNVFWVGEISRQRANTARAESSFQQYRQLAEQLTAIDPSNDDWQGEVAYAESALGAVLLQEGSFTKATAAFEHSLAVAKDRVTHHPEDLNLQFDMGQRHVWLADSLEKQGHLAAAADHVRAAIQIYRATLSKDSTNQQARFATIDALTALGQLARIMGDQKEALADFTQSAELGEALLAGERENMDLTGVVASAQVDLGESRLAAGQLEAALAAQQRATALLTAALAHDDTVALWHNCRDRATLLEAAIEGKRDKRAQALQLDSALLNRLESTVGADSKSETLWLLERARLQTGDDAAALGRREDALKLWAAIVTSLPAPIDGYEPMLLEVLAAAHTRLGRSAEAQNITNRLQSSSLPANTSGIVGSSDRPK